MKKEIEMASMNEDLHNEFQIQELEERLETDPLLVGGLTDLIGSGIESEMDCFCFSCTLCSPVVG